MGLLEEQERPATGSWRFEDRDLRPGLGLVWRVALGRQGLLPLFREAFGVTLRVESLSGG